MRIESSITSVSWIPSEAIKGMTKMPFEVGGVAHYDQSGIVRLKPCLIKLLHVRPGELGDGFLSA